MSGEETALMREMRIEASKLGARLLRQNSGQGWVGRVERGAGRRVTLGPGDVVVRSARPLHAGFKGWADLGGWVPVTVTPDMVGQVVAVYLQAEVKDGSRASPEQLAWIDAVNAAGGRAAVVSSLDELRALLCNVPP